LISPVFPLKPTAAYNHGEKFTGPTDIVCRSVPPKGSVELEKTGWPFTIAVGTRPLDPITGPILMLGNALL